jgi:hypothetical protein
MIRSAHMRRFCSSNAKTIKQWPFIERKALSSALERAFYSAEPGLTLVNGGLESGKTEALYRAVGKRVTAPHTGRTLTIVLDFDNLPSSSASCESSDPAKECIRQISRQMALQLNPTQLFHLFNDHCPQFSDSFIALVSSKPLWKHLQQSAKTLEECWGRIVTSQSIAVDVLSQIRFCDDPRDELISYIELLRSAEIPVSLCLMHIECLGKAWTLVDVLCNPAFNVLVECNDPLMCMWVVCGDSGREWNVIEVDDLPKEALAAVFVPALLSDSVQVDILNKVCGGRVGLLQKFFGPLSAMREQQKLQDMEQERRYRSGKENRPSSESKELQVDPLVHQRDVVLRDSFIDGVLCKESERFIEVMDHVLNETASLASLRDNFTPTEYKVFVIESIKGIFDKIRTQGSVPLPASLSPLDIAHPVVLGLLEKGILMMRWSPYPRLVEASPSSLIQIDAWVSAQLEGLGLDERVKYNMIAMRNRIHIDRQLGKLSR